MVIEQLIILHVLIVLCFIIIDMNQVRLINVIGQGSFGTVYRAVWRGSLVATKVIQMGEESRHTVGEVEKCR